MLEWNNSDAYDVVGIGFGPANIALAIAAEEQNSPLSFKFLERNMTSGWHDEMLLPESDIQNHPLRDLVTPRNPKSHYTFVNFLFENGRLFEHLNLPIQHPLRVEYRQYVSWVARHFDKWVDYGKEVTAVTPISVNGEVDRYAVHLANGESVNARSVVVAPGRTPNIPIEFLRCHDERVVHLTKFGSSFSKIKKLKRNPTIVVVGGSQTAVELLLHLVNEMPNAKVIGINRGFGFRLKDTSPFSEEVYFPAFVEMFFHATKEQKLKLRKELVFTNYSSVDRDILDALYVRQYRNKISGQEDLDLKHLTTITAVEATSEGVLLNLINTISGKQEEISADLVILATGFKDLGDGTLHEAYPPLLKNVAEYLELGDGSLEVDINYRVCLKESAGVKHAPLFLNGLCESSHGMGDAGSFSLLALRSAAILGEIERLLQE